MTEPKERKNPDYTASAINLVNPAEVKALLINRCQLEEGHRKAAALLEATTSYQLVANLTDQLRENYEQLKLLIDQMGSYQDQNQGWYAIAQRKVSYRYIPERVRAEIPAPLSQSLMIEEVDKTRLERLVKAGLVTQQQAENCKEVTKSETAYIIRC